MVATLFVLILFGWFSYELFFALAFVGLVTFTWFILPFRATPEWQQRLRWIIFVGLAGFVYIVFKQIRDLLPGGGF
jgi:hypothetical protein